MIEEALADVHAAAESMARLATFEDCAAEFCRRAGLPGRAAVADHEVPVRARDFDRRVTQQTATESVAKRVARPPVPVPNFSALVQ